MIIACKCLNVSVEIKGNINSEHNSQFAAVDDKNIEFVDKFLDEINFQKVKLNLYFSKNYLIFL